MIKNRAQKNDAGSPLVDPVDPYCYNNQSGSLSSPANNSTIDTPWHSKYVLGAIKHNYISLLSTKWQGM